MNAVPAALLTAWTAVNRRLGLLRLNGDGKIDASLFPTLTLSGDVTGSGTTAIVATIANDAVTYAKMQNVSATDKLLGRSTAGAGDVEEIACTSFGRALLDDASVAAQRTTLGLVIGTDVQAYDAELAALAGQTSAADKLFYFTGSGSGSLCDFRAAGRSIVAAPIAAKGDLIVGTAVNTVDVVTVGANNTVPTANSADSTGIRWAHRSRLFADPPIVDGTPHHTSTSESSALMTCTVGSGMNVNKAQSRITVMGEHGVTGSPTLTIKLKFNGTTIFTVSLTVSAGSNMGWSLEMVVTTRSTGASGSMHAQLVSGFFRGAVTGSTVGSTVTTVDATSGDFTLTAQWSVSSASNTIQVDAVVPEALNW